MERNGTTINRSAMKQCVDVLLTLRDTTIKATLESTVYKLYLESEILKESEIYYTNRAKEMLDIHDLAQYVQLVRTPPLGQFFLLKRHRWKCSSMRNKIEHTVIYRSTLPLPYKVF
jgi:hypothetical protein